ncbi:MAG: septum formation initiator family protein [Candidatus Berkelbacteria bacterium]|nr:septum formation initiator family protein [Candidatus Berkelbacteria bacterium]
MKKGYLTIGIIVLIYLSVLVGRSVYKNWKTEQILKKIRTEIETFEVENQNLQNLIVYYQTPSFKEKEARRKLGLVRPDEKVAIISKEPEQQKKASVASATDEVKKPNYILWWEYFFANKTI